MGYSNTLPNRFPCFIGNAGRTVEAPWGDRVTDRRRATVFLYALKVFIYALKCLPKFENETNY